MIDLQNIPNNWSLVEFEEAVDILDSRREPINSEEREKRTSGLDQSDLYPYYGAGGQIGWIDDYIFDDELILLAEDGATTGYVYLVSGKSWINNHAHVLREKPEVIKKLYLYYYLKHYNFDHLKTGGTRPKLTQTNMKKVKIPVPPLDEQERIVEDIEERLERVERLEKSVEAVGRLADEYEDSFVTSLILDNMSGYSGVLPSDEDLPSNWSMSKISEVTSVNGNYTYPEDEFPEKEFNYISVSEVDGGTGQIVDSQQLLGKECSTRARRKISEDDVILSTVRPYLKAFALVPQEYDGAIASTAFAVLTAENNIEPEYLYRAVRSPLFVNQLKSKQKGASYPEVRLSEVKESVIPVPPKEKQMEVVEKIDKIDFRLLEKSVSDVEGLFEEYRSSILAHAFQGKAVY